MSKKLIAAALLAAVTLTSARYVAPRDGRMGYQAPELVLSNDSVSLDLKQYSGRYVLVTFWASSQPESRLANKQITAATNGRMACVAVNLDRTRGLFDQLVEADHLDAKSQFYVPSELQSEIMLAWRQRPDKFTSFLIAPDGRIVKENPTIADLAVAMI